MMQWATNVEVSPSMEAYIVDLCQATRTDPALMMGASTRAALSLMRAGRVLAASQGREAVLPEDIKALIKSVLSHRLILTPDAGLREETVENVVERIIARVKIPVGVKD
jgi:MoxR-like ATPase